VEHDTRKFRGARHRGQAGAPARPARTGRARSDQPSPEIESRSAAVLATVISEVLQRYDPQHPPQDSAELYSDLFIDSRKFLMIIRGLERVLEREIDDEDLLGVDLITYGDLVKFVDGISSEAKPDG
jgi:acyl carrier protein